MEEMHGARYGERARSFHAPSRRLVTQYLHKFTNLESSPNSVLWGFYGGLNNYVGMID